MEMSNIVWKKTSLNQLYDIMYDHMDPTGWWPGRSDW